MPFQALPYTSDRRNEWDAFVRDTSRNGGLFHEQHFLGYHPPGRFVDRSVMLYDEDGLAAVFPAASKPDLPDDVISHPGSTAGGLVYRRNATMRETMLALEALLSHYREQKVKKLEMRLAEPIFADPHDGELSFLLWHRGFQLKSREISCCTDLTRPEDWRSFGRKGNPNYIRGAQRKGLTAGINSDHRQVYELIESNLKARYGKPPTHSWTEFEDLIKRYPDRIQCWAVKLEGTIIAAVSLFRVTDKTVHNFYTGQDWSHSKLHPMPLLFNSIFEHYRAAGLRWFNFGISSRGDWIKWGILEFKEQMGGRSLSRDVWVLPDVSGHKPYQFDNASAGAH